MWRRASGERLLSQPRHHAPSSRRLRRATVAWCAVSTVRCPSRSGAPDRLRPGRLVLAGDRLLGARLLFLLARPTDTEAAAGSLVELLARHLLPITGGEDRIVGRSGAYALRTALDWPPDALDGEECTAQGRVLHPLVSTVVYPSGMPAPDANGSLGSTAAARGPQILPSSLICESRTTVRRRPR